MHVFLETARLVLRHFTKDDADELVSLDSDPEVMRFLTGGKPTSRAMVEADTLPKFLEFHEDSETFGYFAAIEKTTEDFLGWFEFRPPEGESPENVELGYRLKQSAWGKGYATEGSLALIRTGFTDLGVERVFATTMLVNAASRRVMEKAGMSHVRTFHGEWKDPIKGSGHGEVEYELRRSSWEEREGRD